MILGNAWWKYRKGVKLIFFSNQKNNNSNNENISQILLSRARYSIECFICVKKQSKKAKQNGKDAKNVSIIFFK